MILKILSLLYRKEVESGEEIEAESVLRSLFPKSRYENLGMNSLVVEVVEK